MIYGGGYSPGNGRAAPLPNLVINPAPRITEAGDSIPRGFFSGSDNAAYACFLPLRTLLTAAFTAAGKTGPTYTNTAVTGQTSAALLAGLATQVIATSPDVLLVIIGANDVGFGLTPEQTFANTSGVISGTLASFPNCIIHWFGCPLRSSEQIPDGISSDAGGVLAANSAMAAACAKFPANARFWNMRQGAYGFEGAKNTPAPGAASGLLTTDGTHNTKTGDRPAGESGAEIYSGFAYSVMTLNLT